MRKTSGLVMWGPSGPLLFKHAPPFLFEGFWVYTKGFLSFYAKNLWGAIRKASGCYLKRKPSGLVCWGPSGPFFFKHAPPFLFEGYRVYSKTIWVLFASLLDWFAGALRAPSFLNTLRLFYSRAPAFIQRPSGFYSRAFWIGPLGPFFFKHAPPFLFEGLRVYSNIFLGSTRELSELVC